ncbi:hypothetical protein ACS0TY_032807 [Phlomoides rotata]
MLQDRVPTIWNLLQREAYNPNYSTKCRVCGNFDEDTTHLFFQCRSALEVWKRVCNWFDLSNFRLETWGAELKEHERQKENVKTLVEQTPNESTYKIEVIDAIQRLGVGYHFEKEIDKSLQCIHDTHDLMFKDDDKDLRVVALRFRLLRQHGYHVPCEVFKKFMDEQGKFEESVVDDVEGMLSLYEASNYGVDGEEILEKALEFCSSHLESLLPKLANPLATRVIEALKSPISKSINRLVATKFIPTYQQDDSHNEILLNFAKLDFNLVQKLYHKELRDITRWWKDLDFANKLPFARDRVVECYFWIVGVYFEPQYAAARIILTKVIYMAAVLDDIYDVHGTLDELQLFTNILQSWDIEAVDQLPPYMRIFYKALLDVYVEMEAMVDAGESYRVQYAKEEMKKLGISYLEEAEWNYSKYMPTMEEYMKVSLVSCGYVMMTITSLVGIKQVTKQEFDWVLNEPLVVRASLTICRLMDDLVGYKCEEKISAMNCYMNTRGCSETEAFRELGEQVKNAWKDINKEMLEPRPASMPILMPILNLTRVINILYGDEDGFSNSKAKTKDLITCVLVEPVPT